MVKELKNPKISVIIPTYNRGYLLNKAIESVLNQTFKDFELIIIDDGSTDNTKEIVKNFQKKEKRVRYIWQENSGAPASPKNKGILNSRGEFVAFLDSDDKWLPKKLEKQIALFDKSKKLGIVSCNHWNIYVNQNLEKREHKINLKVRKDPFKNILKECFISSSSSIVVPRVVFDKVGLYDEQFKTSDDRDLYIRILRDYSFDFIEESLFDYYIHNSNLSNCDSRDSLEYYSRSLNEILKVFNKHEKEYHKNPKIKSMILRKMANYYLLIGDKENSKKYLWMALKTMPFRLRNYTNLIILYFFGRNIYLSIGKIKRFFILRNK